jgi:hypothetical protein
MGASKLVRSIVMVSLLAAVLTLDVQPATAAAAKVQNGPLVTATSGSFVMTVPAATTAGTLLVATLAYSGSSPAFVGPSGWTRGPNVANASGGTEIWYYGGNPGSISSVTFTYTTTTVPGAGGALSEWSGLAPTSPLDKSGTATAASVASVTVATSTNVAAAGELAITSFSHVPSNSNQSFNAPPTNWTNLVKLTGANAFTSDYRLGVPTGSPASEVETSNRTGSWAAAIATFRLPCTAGSLSLGTPSNLSFPAVTLNGQNQQATTSVVLTPSDLTASGAGWNTQVTSTTFTNAGGKTLSISASTITSASVAAAPESCVAPTSSITYPLTVPAAATAPTAVKVYNAASATGRGTSNVTLGVQLAVPGNAYNGTYSSTWTFTIASGP